MYVLPKPLEEKDVEYKIVCSDFDNFYLGETSYEMF